MGLRFDTAKVIQERDFGLSTGPATGFGENYGANWDLMVNEGQSISRNRAINERLINSFEAMEEANVAPLGFDLNFLLEQGNTRSDLGTVGSDVRQHFNREAREKYSEAVKLNQQFGGGDTRIMSFDEIMDDIARDFEKERERILNITGRATGMGKLGQFAGVAAGAISDPTVVATLPFGASWSSGILRAASIDAAIAGAVEVPIQAGVFQFKEEIGSPYSLGDAGLAIAGAGVGAGVFSATLRGVPRGSKALIDHVKGGGLKRPLNANEKEALNILEAREEELAESPLPRDPADDGVYAETLQRNVNEVADDMPRVLDDGQTASKFTIDETEVDMPGKFVADLDEAVVRASDPTDKIDTPQRIQLRQDVETRLYGKGAKNRNRRADIVIGGPGAGKTSALARPLAKEKGSLIIDPDDAKEALPEFDNGKGSVQVHKEGSAISDKVLQTAVSNGDNVILSRTGKSIDKLRKLIELLEKQGYSVNLHHVDLDPAVALGRVIERHGREGRVVPPELVESAAIKSKENFEILRKEGKLNGFSEFSNDVPAGSPARVISATEKRLKNLGTDGGRVGRSDQQGLERNTPEEGNLTGTHGTDEARMAEARKIADDFDAEQAGLPTRIDDEYARLLDEVDEKTKIPLDRIDDTGQTSTKFTTLGKLNDEVQETQDVLKQIGGCAPGA
ncbi:MAG: zeta toxin family protein [Pseudohongiellaceae bacterium]